MASLKDLRNRIGSVKSTQKITSAMKMVAAAKLRRAQEQAEAARPYGERMERMLGSLAASMTGEGPRLLTGTGKDDTHLVVVATADRGLCGGFNSSIVREARKHIRRLREDGKTVKILCVGRKGRDMLRRDYRDLIIETIEDIAKPALSYDRAAEIAEKILAMFGREEFDVCTFYFARFKSAISNIVTGQQLIPFRLPESDESSDKAEDKGAAGRPQSYEFEPEEEAILASLLPKNVAVQIYTALLENAASEHGSRMTAMDNATRNASEMIDKLTLVYNRTRQAVITRELIEIISAKEAM